MSLTRLRVRCITFPCGSAVRVGALTRFEDQENPPNFNFAVLTCLCTEVLNRVVEDFAVTSLQGVAITGGVVATVVDLVGRACSAEAG